MKILIIYIIVVFGLSSNLIAQYNYVPNSSFEQFYSYPTTGGGIDDFCTKWFTPMSKMLTIPPFPYSINNKGSSDFYNEYSITPLCLIPDNTWGYQAAMNGNAYSGIIFSNEGPAFNDYKEYIEIELNKKLSKNRIYCLEFYYSIAERFCTNPNNYYPIELGAILTDTIVSRLSGINTQQPQNIFTIPQVSQQLPQIIDTINWIKISGTFIANGREQFLTIGNFQQTDTLTNKNVYVYIDDVKLYYCGPDTTPQPTGSMIVPNVFTPNDDGYNDKFEFKNQEQWQYETQIFNRWGHLIFDNSKSENWDGYLNGVQATPGVYYYVIRAAAIKTGEVVVYRGTVTVLY